MTQQSGKTQWCDTVVSRPGMIQHSEKTQWCDAVVSRPDRTQQSGKDVASVGPLLGYLMTKVWRVSGAAVPSGQRDKQACEWTCLHPIHGFIGGPRLIGDVQRCRGQAIKSLSPFVIQSRRLLYMLNSHH
jgi:hypothetical protein